jgi:hypothetical protein
MIYRIRELILAALLGYVTLRVIDLGPHLFAVVFTLVVLCVLDALADVTLWLWDRLMAYLHARRGT